MTNSGVPERNRTSNLPLGGTNQGRRYCVRIQLVECVSNLVKINSGQIRDKWLRIKVRFTRDKATKLAGKALGKQDSEKTALAYQKPSKIAKKQKTG